MATKWTVLEGRLAWLREQAARIEADMKWMERTECGVPCSGCNEMLATEAEFAKHFVLYSIAALNIGRCPKVEV